MMNEGFVSGLFKVLRSTPKGGNGLCKISMIFSVSNRSLRGLRDIISIDELKWRLSFPTFFSKHFVFLSPPQ